MYNQKLTKDKKQNKIIFTKMEEFKSGKYKVQGLFWICIIDNKKKSVKVIKKIKMKPLVLVTTKTNDLIKQIWHCLELINSQLPLFLKENDIKRWFPARNITYDTNKSTTIEICYYQDQNMYDIVYKSVKNMILEPNVLIKAGLDKFYHTYNLDSHCEHIYAQD